MVHGRSLGGLGLLAVGLGIGAAVIAMPGVASADDSSARPFPWLGGINPGGPDVPAASTPTLDFQISINGHDLFPTADNTATAYSGIGDIAIAHGDGAVAEAGAGPDVFGSPVDHGLFDIAVARGTDSLAAAGTGNFDAAFADGNNTISDDGGYNGVVGNFDHGAAIGANAEADAGVFSTTSSSYDSALVVDGAATPLGSTANAGDGNFDHAFVFGDNSVAVAGGMGTLDETGASGSHDLGAVFGSGLGPTTGAIGGDHLTEILPHLFGDVGSASAATEGGGLLAELLSLF